MAPKKGSGRKKKSTEVTEQAEQLSAPEIVAPAADTAAAEAAAQPAAPDTADDLQKKVAEMREAASEILADAGVDGVVDKAKKAVKDNPVATGVAAAGLVAGAPLVLVALGVGASTKSGRETARKYFDKAADRAKGALDAAQKAVAENEAKAGAGETPAEPDPLQEAKAVARAAISGFFKRRP